MAPWGDLLGPGGGFDLPPGTDLQSSFIRKLAHTVKYFFVYRAPPVAGVEKKAWRGRNALFITVPDQNDLFDPGNQKSTTVDPRLPVRILYRGRQ